MGLCESHCTGLTEGVCQATAGCYAAYFDDPTTDGGRYFEGCWQTSPSGPVGGSCQGLSAYECARHDNCALVYDSSSAGTKFSVCITEPAQGCDDDLDCSTGSHCEIVTCQTDPSCPSCPNCGVCADVCSGVCVADNPSCAAVDCGPGYHCEEQCYPADGTNGPTMGWCTTACVPNYSSCSLIDCGPGYQCVDSCQLSGNGTFWCSSECVPTNTGDPGSCYGEVACDALPPACPMGTTAGRTSGCWTGYCIPDADCGPNNPGECYGTVVCDAVAPACPSGTTPGIANGCYTGYCIPNGQCAPPACETASSESACASRNDCTAIYTGTNCTCTPNGCTCTTLSYARCQPAYMPL
jgi:hypothetical protein